MKRLVFVLMCMIGMAFAITACGGSGDSGSSTSNTGAATSDEGEQEPASEQEESGEETEVTVATGPVTSLAAYELGVQKGFFTEEGLKIHNQEVPTGAASIPLLLNGQLSFAFGSPDAAMAAISEGVPVKLAGSFAGETPDGAQYGTIVPADSPIKSWKDLAGKTLGVNSIQSGWEFWNREAVNQSGGDGEAIKFVPIPFANQLPAYERGQIDALSTTQPILSQALAEGSRLLGNPVAEAFGEPEANPSVTIVSSKMAETEPEVIERFQRAMKKSAEYGNQHPDEIYKVASELTGAPLDAVEESPLPQYTWEINKDTVETEADFLQKFGVIEEVPDFNEVFVEAPVK